VGHNDLLTLVVFLLVFACIVSAILVVRGDADTRRLESRIRSLHEVAVGPAGGAAARQHPRSIQRTTGGTPLARALERIGRSRHIPKERRLPWPMIAAGGLGGAAAAGYVGAQVVNAAVAPAFGVAAAVLFVRFLFRWEASRYQAQLFRQLPDAMGLIMRAIRAGLPMGEALANVARELSSPSREEFAQVVSNVAIGQPIDQALFGLAERSGLTEYYFFAVTVGLQAQTGGNLGETLENLADMVRKRVSMAGRVKALTAEARISAIVMAVLPFCVGALITLLKPGHLDPMFETDLGFRLLLVGGVMLGIGLMVIRGLLKSALKD
jgi:tight adherence protein B